MKTSAREALSFDAQFKNAAVLILTRVDRDEVAAVSASGGVDGASGVARVPTTVATASTALSSGGVATGAVTNGVAANVVATGVVPALQALPPAVASRKLAQVSSKAFFTPPLARALQPRTYAVRSEDDLPRLGELLPIDAEFVSLAPEINRTLPSGAQVRFCFFVFLSRVHLRQFSSG